MNGASILVALGMLGAIVMPHNIYLHSNVIQSRDWDVAPAQHARLMHFELADTTLAMGMGWLVNSAMIIVAAAVFFSAGREGHEHRAGVADAGAAGRALPRSSSSASRCWRPASARR